MAPFPQPRLARAQRYGSSQIMTGKLIQFGGSLVAILVLAWIALKLGLGGEPRIRDEGHLRELAEDALCGFDPVEIAIATDGQAALARDGEDRVMLLRRHGAHFASRLLDSAARVKRDGSVLLVASSDRRFGEARLELRENASAWAERIERL
jgi:hypothetical protein